MASEIWTERELDASVETYMDMLSKEYKGIPYKKSDYRARLLSGALKSRSVGSFEYRMQNISHVLNTLGQRFIAGYKPARNVGPSVFESILASFERHKIININDYKPTADLQTLQQRTEKIRAKIDLGSKPPGQKHPKAGKSTATCYYRDPVVRAWVLKFANGKCEACQMQAPFILTDGEPFLEVHHMVPLAENGSDTIENAVALCPNCHRRCHLSNDKDNFNNSIYKRVERLRKSN